MGMFDSLYVDCPVCGKELEFQSKTGECFLSAYHEDDLTPIVAYGMDGNIVKCQFCRSRIQLKCDIPDKVKIKLINKGVEGDYDYPGNFNMEEE